MTNQAQNPNDKRKYDLADRTSLFGKNIIEFVLFLPKSPVNNPLVSQIVRSSTSIGANYMEADCAESKKDFRHKIAICKKEAKETTHWLDMLTVADSGNKQKYSIFRQEAHELLLIFSSILNNSKQL
ncbi:MAG: four helix bundle protein [Candidatus Pacebacteria bacterium]|jgi:four helix bundle protein|nr:four helix bundle protein [Candidatus Paceibacterota bacterium]